MEQQKKVLIVDDEIDLCLLLKSYFLRKNYEVYLSHTLEQGVDFINKIKPDILFLDNNLPDGVGWDVAPGLCSQFPDMYINLISGFHPSPPSMPDNARYTVIEKPLSFSDLDRQLAAMKK